MIKKSFFVILTVIVLAIIFAVPKLIPETWTIKVETTIEAPSRVVFALLNDLRNWELWSPWGFDNSSAVPKYLNGGFGRGGTIVWPSEAGYQQRFVITHSEPHQSFEIAMDFGKNGFGISRINLQENASEKTSVTWNYGLKTEGWKSLLTRQAINQSIKNALNNLSSTAEFWNQNKFIVVEPGVISDFPYVSIRRQIGWDELSEEMGKMYELLASATSEGNYRIIGHPYSIYHAMGEERVDVECGYPVESQVANIGIIMSGTYSEAMCAMTEYTGSFETLEKGHEAVQQWIEVRNISLSGPPMEIYINNESAEWTTRIVYPIEVQYIE